MDPLSAVSGITGTVAVGAKVLTALHGFAKGFKSAPEELKLLTRELDDLCQIMDNFREKTGGQMVNQCIEDSSGAILDIFIQLKQLVIEHAVSEKDGFLKKGWKQVKWHCIEKDIADLRAHLNSNKGNLLVALALGNKLHNGHSNMKLERVQGALEEVIERLQDREMQTVATCESFTLRRWQELEVSSTIAPWTPPTTPNDQISFARSDSGIFSEAGFSVRSISMSTYRFNDIGARGKGFLISDGTHTKAYTVEARKQKEGLDSKPPEAGVPIAGPSGRSSRPPTKTTKPAPLTSIPEPEEGDEAPGAKDDSKSRMSTGIQMPIETPRQKDLPKPHRAFRGARHRLNNFSKKRGSKVDFIPVPEKKGQVTPDTIHDTPDFSIGRYLQTPEYSVGPQKSMGKTHARQLEVRQIQALAGSDRSIARLGDSLGMRGAIALAIPALEMYCYVARRTEGRSKLELPALLRRKY